MLPRKGWRAGLCLLASLVLCGARAEEPLLEYRVEGVDGALRENVEAWLGEAPQSPSARANLVAGARERINRSLEALGYYRADIDLSLDREREPWQLTVRIDPREPVRIRELSLAVTGEAAEDPAFQRFRETLPLSEGEVFHHGEYQSMKNALLTLGQRRGYFDARLQRHRVEVEATGGSADIDLLYASGTRYRFGAIQQEPADLLAVRHRQALQPFEQGEPFSLEALQTFQSRLQRTGYFSGITLRPELDERSDGEIPLRLELFPAPRHSIDVGLGYSTDTEERVSMVWRTPRINRYGHSQETRLEYSAVNPSGRVTWNIPLTHPLDDVLQLRARVEENEFGDLDSRQQELAVRREQRSGEWVRSLSLRFLNERWDADPVRGNEDYLLPGISLAHKWREGPLVNPERGFSQYYSLEGASESLGGTLDLVRLHARWVHVMSFGDRHRVVSRAEAGAVYLDEEDRDRLAPSLGFFAGGSQSLRGFAYQSIGNPLPVMTRDGQPRDIVLGGDRLLLGSLEYQYRVRPDWRLAVFSDVGDAFNEGELDLNYALGTGLHYLTPVGALKLEVARSLSKDQPGWRLHINIGAEF
jgi:translocation and assembly module TamA